MNKSILYLGDTELTGAASYPAGVMTHYGIDFDYLPSDEKFDSELLKSDYKAIVISDYPVANFTAGQLNEVIEKVRGGVGVLMIGGWESFTGCGGDYNKTPLTEVLPVIMSDTDDRVNFSGCCPVEKAAEHEILRGLDFEGDAPAIGGLNSFAAKDQSEVILRARLFGVSQSAGLFSFTAKDSFPLLVAGEFGKGRTAAFASDVAPHWVGPLVDWGGNRICVKAKGAEAIEVGECYARFFANLILWTAQMETV